MEEKYWLQGYSKGPYRLSTIRSYDTKATATGHYQQESCQIQESTSLSISVELVYSILALSHLPPRLRLHTFQNSPPPCACCSPHLNQWRSYGPYPITMEFFDPRCKLMIFVSRDAHLGQDWLVPFTWLTRQLSFPPKQPSPCFDTHWVCTKASFASCYP